MVRVGEIRPFPPVTRVEDGRGSHVTTNSGSWLRGLLLYSRTEGRRSDEHEAANLESNSVFRKPGHSSVD